jgi:hypothetical protein
MVPLGLCNAIALLHGVSGCMDPTVHCYWLLAGQATNWLQLFSGHWNCWQKHGTGSFMPLQWLKLSSSGLTLQELDRDVTQFYWMVVTFSFEVVAGLGVSSSVASGSNAGWFGFLWYCWCTSEAWLEVLWPESRGDSVDLRAEGEARSAKDQRKSKQRAHRVAKKMGKISEEETGYGISGSY